MNQENDEATGRGQSPEAVAEQATLDTIADALSTIIRQLNITNMLITRFMGGDVSQAELDAQREPVVVQQNFTLNPGATEQTVAQLRALAPAIAAQAHASVFAALDRNDPATKESPPFPPPREEPMRRMTRSHWAFSLALFVGMLIAVIVIHQ